MGNGGSEQPWFRRVIGLSGPFAQRLRTAQNRTENRVAAQLVMVHDVLAVQRGPEHPLAQRRRCIVHNPIRRATVRRTIRKPIHQTDRPVRRPQKQRAGVRGHRPAPKSATTPRPFSRADRVAVGLRSVRVGGFLCKWATRCHKRTSSHAAPRCTCPQRELRDRCRSTCAWLRGRIERGALRCPGRRCRGARRTLHDRGQYSSLARRANSSAARRQRRLDSGPPAPIG